MRPAADQAKAYLYALGAVLIWSTVATAFKLSLRSLSPAQLLLYASLTSTLLLGAILAGQGRLAAAFACSRRQWLLSLGLGLLNPLFYYLVLFQAYALLPAQEAQPLNYTWALTLSLLAVPLLGHRLTLRDGLAILVSYAGVVVIATHGHPLQLHFASPLGVVLALFSTVLWALYWIYNARDRRPPLAGLFLNFCCSLPCIFFYCLLAGELKRPDLGGLLGAVYVGCFEMGISFLLWLQALKYTSSTAKISNLIFISPFLSLLLIHLLVGEAILPSTFVGLILIVVGLLLQQVGKGEPAA